MWAAAIVILAGMACLTTGCAVNGWATRDVPDPARFEPGTTLTVIQNDGTKLNGEYRGMVTIPDREYAEQYVRSTRESNLSNLLPTIGQSVNVTTALTETRSWNGELVGFDNTSLYIRPEGSQETEQFYIGGLTSLTGGNGTVLRRAAIRSLFLDGKIPLMSAIVLKSYGYTVQIPLNRVLDLVEHESAPAGQPMLTAGSR